MQGLRQLANKMEKILLAALQNYGNTFVEPKIELGARFGHLVCEYTHTILVYDDFIYEHPISALP